MKAVGLAALIIAATVAGSMSPTTAQDEPALVQDAPIQPPDNATFDDVPQIMPEEPATEPDASTIAPDTTATEPDQSGITLDESGMMQNEPPPLDLEPIPAPNDTVAAPEEPSLLAEPAMPLDETPPATGEEPLSIPNPSDSPNPLANLDLQGLSATRSLPLFTPSRTPPPEAVGEVAILEPQVTETPTPGQPTPPPVQLIGIVTAQGEEVALLADQASGSVLRFHSGDEYDGWVMTIVDSRTVEFELGDERRVLTMFAEFGGQPAPATENTGEEYSPDMQFDPSAQEPPPEEVPVEEPVDPQAEQDSGIRRPQFGRPLPGPPPQQLPTAPGG